MNWDVTRQEVKILLLTVFLALCGGLGLDIHLASLPYIMTSLATTKTIIQQSISVYILGAVSVLVYGPLSDKFGRKPLVLIGLAIFTIANFLIIAVKTATAFLILRFIQGIGAGVCFGLARTIAADVMQNERLAAIGSYFTLIISLSPLFAPVLGGYIQHLFNWQANFIVLACIVFSVFIAFCVFFDETHSDRDNTLNLKMLFKGYTQFLKHPLFMAAGLLGGIAVATNVIYVTLSPFIFQKEFTTTPIAFGWLTGLVGLSGVLTKIISPFFILRSTNHIIMKAGVWLLIISGIVLGVAKVTGNMGITLLLIGACTAMVSLNLVGVTSMAMALSPFNKTRGSAGAIYSAFQVLLSCFMGGFVAALPLPGTTTLAIIYTLLGILGLGLCRLLTQQVDDAG